MVCQLKVCTESPAFIVIGLAVKELITGSAPDHGHDQRSGIVSVIIGRSKHIGGGYIGRNHQGSH